MTPAEVRADAPAARPTALVRSSHAAMGPRAMRIGTTMRRARPIAGNCARHLLRA